MTNNNNNLVEIRRYAEKASQSQERIMRAKSASELRDAWEEFVWHFAKCIGRQISSGLGDQRSRGWAHRLKNASNGGDPGLFFLREARNAVEHGLTPFAEFNEPAVHIGGNLVRLEGGGSVTMVDCTFNGTPMGSFHVSTSGGRVDSIIGQPNISIEQVPRTISLVTISNPEKGVSVDVPIGLAGKTLESGRPDDLAELGVAFLYESLEDLERLWGVG